MVHGGGTEVSSAMQSFGEGSHMCVSRLWAREPGLGLHGDRTEVSSAMQLVVFGQEELNVVIWIPVFGDGT
jgi:hypothetical protein